MKALGLALALSGLAAPPAPAAASAAFPDYPKSAGLGDVGRWLSAQTDMPLNTVVLVGPGYVFSFLPPDPQRHTEALIWKQVREEATSVVMASRLGGRSATASIAFDCVQNQAAASNVTVYAGNNLRGDPGSFKPAAEWLSANPGLYLIDLAKAACDPAFKRPFAGGIPAQAAAAAPAAHAVAGREPAAPTRARAAESGPSHTGPLHWAQVGAYASAAAAQQRWRQIQQQLPAQSAGRTFRTEPAGHLVRALVGPFHGADAATFCAALKAREGDCLVR